MKEFDIILRFKKEKGEFTVAQINKLLKGICVSRNLNNSTNRQAGRQSGSRKRK